MENANTVMDLGKLSGKLLVFGGAYSNLQALQKLQQIAADADIPASNVICTGDVVAYCAQPEETVQTVRDWGIHCVLGNVEIQLRDGEMNCGCDFADGGRCNLFSANWYAYAQEKMSADSLAWMGSLPDHIRFDYAGKRVLVVHGGLDATAQYVFASTPWAEKSDQLRRGAADIVLSGHSGLPFGQVNHGQAWLNAGVIGMPANDGTQRVWYMLMEEAADGGWNYAHHSFEYESRVTASLMRVEGLPEPYALTLETGVWDNMEILPEAERALRGVPIELDLLRV